MNDDDNKVMAMTHLLDSLKYSSYPIQEVYKVLNALEKHGVKYLLDELPEGETYTYYSNKLDAYIIDVIKKRR